MRRFSVVVLAALALAGCGDEGSGTSLERGPSADGFRFTAESDIKEGQAIAARFTCDGEDAVPVLRWEGVPKDAQQLALAVEDPDAPGKTFTHWLVWGLDPSETSLPSGDPSQGKNDFDRVGYDGPCPPEGEEHRYVFRLFALDSTVDPGPEADRRAFDEAVDDYVIAEAQLTAPYRRAD